MSNCSSMVVTYSTLPYGRPINLCCQCAAKYPHTLVSVQHGEHKDACDGIDWHPSDGANPRFAMADD
jgi:hypothetical protein